MALGEHLVKETLDLPRWHGVGPLAGELLEEDHVELLRDPGAPELPQDAGPTVTRYALLALLCFAIYAFAMLSHGGQVAARPVPYQHAAERDW